jgi:hypothetical protein
MRNMARSYWNPPQRTPCSLPEIFCLWAAQRGSDWHRRISNLRQAIQ